MTTMQTTSNHSAPYSVLLVGGLLFVDLFLGWHRASVSVGGVVDVHSDSSAWAGWGAIAGVMLIVLLIWEALRASGRAIAQDVTVAVISLLLAFGTLVFVAIEFFAGTASVRSGSVLAVDVSGRQWAAYAGIVLALLLVITTVTQLGRPAERQSGRLGLGVR
jgi:hypothetical protein